ncbi:MAG TPA: hypothetical protein VES36_00455, partial [Candidatus Limnocylindrales bacterium]|nr:hypothetical protein [Candidatus Limnocylindrales bacterium]
VGIAVVKPLDDARPVAFDLHDVIDGETVDGEIVNVSSHARNVLAHSLGEAVNEVVQPWAWLNHRQLDDLLGGPS